MTNLYADIILFDTIGSSYTGETAITNGMGGSEFQAILLLEEFAKLGKKVIISSDSFGEKLEGTVKQIGLLVQKQNIFSNDPGADVDRKVIEVKIALDPETSRKVQNFTYLQVQVAIQL
jgi:hypothetical protein